MGVGFFNEAGSQYGECDLNTNTTKMSTCDHTLETYSSVCCLLSKASCDERADASSYADLAKMRSRRA